MGLIFVQAIEIYMTYIPEWLAIANEVRTAVVRSEKIIFIPEMSL